MNDDEPRTVTGRVLRSFLHGLLPETDQFARQIRWIEDEALRQAELDAMPEFVDAAARLAHLGFA